MDNLSDEQFLQLIDNHPTSTETGDYEEKYEKSDITPIENSFIENTRLCDTDTIDLPSSDFTLIDKMTAGEITLDENTLNITQMLIQNIVFDTNINKNLRLYYFNKLTSACKSDTILRIKDKAEYLDFTLSIFDYFYNILLQNDLLLLVKSFSSIVSFQSLKENKLDCVKLIESMYKFVADNFDNLSIYKIIFFAYKLGTLITCPFFTASKLLKLFFSRIIYSLKFNFLAIESRFSFSKTV